MWYIIENEKDAEIVVGFNQSVDKRLYKNHLANKTLRDILNKEKVHQGDVYFLPPGRIHAIGAGILLAEIQQTSDITYRIYDFDRLDDSGKARELHTELALDAIDYSEYPDYKTAYDRTPDVSNRILQCRYFTANYIELTRALEMDYNEIDSFVVYMCMEGSFSIQYYEKEAESVKKGETVLLPAGIRNIRLVPEAGVGPGYRVQLLEIYIETESAEKRTGDVISKYF